MKNTILHLHVRALTSLEAVLSRRDDRGASLVEYALLMALIAVVCIAAVTALGGTVEEPYSNAGSALLG